MGPVEVNDRDVVVAVTGASAALGGLTLVFLGLTISGFLSFPPETLNVVRKSYRRIAAFSICAFVISLLTMVLGVWWLASSQERIVYVLMLVSSAGLIVLVLLAALFSTWRIMKG